jgi:hypothetical protein
MAISARLDKKTEEILFKTARTLGTTKTAILKASINEFCRKALTEKTQRPYELIADLVGKEYSGEGNLAIDSEKIIRKAFQKKR